MIMIDNIKQFFQDMYDATIGALFQDIANLYLWLGENWDMFLYIVTAILAVIVLYFVFRALAVAKTLLSIFLESAVITGILAFVLWFSQILVTVYNKVIAFAGVINTGGDLGCFGHILSCLSIDGILSVYFTQLLGTIIIILLMRMYQLYIWAKDRIAHSVDRIRFA